jgi:type IV secretory pathway VirB4 component
MDNFGAKVSNALIMNTLAGLDRTETFFDFLQVLVEKTKKRQEPAFTELSEGKSYHAGIIKSKFSLFAEYGILAPENYSYNLDIERMLKQPDIVEVFSTRLVKDKKIRDLLVMYLMKELRKYAIKYRRPTVLVLDELADLCPAKSENYKKVLSNFIGTFLKTMRNMNISVIGLAQDINDIYETVQNGFTQICLGALSSGNARKYYAERFGLSKGELDLLMQAPRGTFIAIGIETKKLIMINH